MPTRAEKRQQKAQRWRLSVRKDADADTTKQKIKKAAETYCKKFTLEMEVLTPLLLEVRWPHSIKYDSVTRFVKRALVHHATVEIKAVEESEGNPVANQELVAHEGAEAALGNVVVLASSACGNGAAASASSRGNVPVAASAIDNALSPGTLPPKLIPLKLSSILGRRVEENNDFNVDWKQKLGKGAFGDVFRGTLKSSGAAVAIKAHEPTERGESDALYEVSVYAALPVNPHHILRILDVGMSRKRACLVFDLHDADLAALLKARRVHRIEGQYILRSVSMAVAVLHAHGLCHNDLKPANVLVSDRGEVLSSSASYQDIAMRTINLEYEMSVVLGDLGTAVLADPQHRALQKSKDKVGIEQGTLWYRSPEVLLGMASYSYPHDMWALGCVAAEMGYGKVLFPGADEEDMRQMIFRMFGTPRGGTLVDLPLAAFLCKSEALEESMCPPTALISKLLHPDNAFLHFVQAALRLEPSDRLTAAGAIGHAFFQPPILTVLWNAVSAHRGAGSFAQGELEPEVLDWLQDDEVWELLAGRCEDYVFGDGKKYEEVGNVRERSSASSSFSAMCNDVACVSTRTCRFAQEFVRCNTMWLRQLTSKIRSALQHVPPDVLGENGKDLLQGCLSDKAFVQSTIQITKSSDSRDAVHFDCGTSLLHLGLTIFGQYHVECWLADGSSRKFEQRPGNVYVANMCAIWHQVGHSLPEDGTEGAEIVILLRSDVFRRSKDPDGKSKPMPEIVFDIVNTVVASHLGSDPLVLPEIRHCLPDAVVSARAPDAIVSARAPDAVVSARASDAVVSPRDPDDVHVSARRTAKRSKHVAR